MSVTIKIADANDSKLLAKLGAVCFSEAFAQYNSEEDLKNYLAEAFSEEMINADLQDKHFTYIIAFDEKHQAVGYSKLNWKETPNELAELKVVQLERIYVRQKVKGKKVGALMMEKCIELAKKKNINSIWLGVWQENIEAINFYKKWGFEIFGYKQFKIGNKVDDDFMMKKNLT